MTVKLPPAIEPHVKKAIVTKVGILKILENNQNTRTCIVEDEQGNRGMFTHEVLIALIRG